VQGRDLNKSDMKFSFIFWMALFFLPLPGNTQTELPGDCEAENATATYCRLGSDGKYIQVTIENFSNFSTSNWYGSYIIPGPSTPLYTYWIRKLLPITFTGSNTLIFPVSSAYSHNIYYIDPNAEECGFSIDILPGNHIPSCDPACNGWEIVPNIKPCETASFQAVNQPNPFPPGTTVTAKVNAKAVALSPDFQYFYDPAQDGSRRWLNVCFTVDQPDCPPYEICKNYFIPDCEAPNDKNLEGRSLIAQDPAAIFRYTNPADQVVLFSQALENAQVELFTMQGVQVRSIQSENIDRVPVADLPNGQYLLSIRHSGGRENRLVHIQHQ
jgi:hypothetical protein